MPDPAQRRKLRFNSIDEVLAEAERLAAAEREGRVTQLGNWTLGTILNHLATWAEFPLCGYPPSIRAPLPVRMILRLMRNKILTQGMMPGIVIRGIPGGTLGIEPAATGQSLPRYRTALEQLRTTCPTVVNPVFGKLSHNQWLQLNLRHAELHFGYLLTT
jgi:hypothetical protein